ncbi:helix-turn-helix protein [Mucilaginibacter oryzae]|uniref:Helix-turn-helix protein n=1 Tax=Mucilaginibacter oryzae TaxID=468058 RepID=A0A316HC54_9SPHI|nr:helix-turn-helix transcriptional regulator [Mucilaginibacter oryzae]PWK68267.1 helix-turn-helix protein [Mucilaginibacter oryzae]
MIKNSKQAAITKVKLEQLKQDFDQFQKTQQGILNPIRYKLGVKSFEGLINDLAGQLERYEQLIQRPVNLFSGFKLVDLTELLTQVRLAKDMSQKMLAEKIGVQEQQIQRYEQDDYTKASWSRIIEVYHALGLDIALVPFNVSKTVKPTGSVKLAQSNKWSVPTTINRDSIESARRTTKEVKSLFKFSV